MARTRTSNPDKQRSQMLQIRIEPLLVEAIEKLHEQNPDVDTFSEMARLLIRQGIQAVVVKNQAHATPELVSPEKYEQRVFMLLEMLSETIAQQETHDPKGAIRTSQRIALAVQGYSEELQDRHKVGAA